MAGTTFVFWGHPSSYLSYWTLACLVEVKRKEIKPAEYASHFWLMTKDVLSREHKRIKDLKKILRRNKDAISLEKKWAWWKQDSRWRKQKDKGEEAGPLSPSILRKQEAKLPKPWSQGQLDGVYWGYTVKQLIRGSHFAITKSEASGDRTQKCVFFKSSPNIYAY